MSEPTLPLTIKYEISNMEHILQQMNMYSEKVTEAVF